MPVDTRTQGCSDYSTSGSILLRWIGRFQPASTKGSHYGLLPDDRSFVAQANFSNKQSFPGYADNLVTASNGASKQLIPVCNLLFYTACNTPDSGLQDKQKPVSR